MRAPPGSRDAYRAFVPLPTRWHDNDAYGHMNNAVYYALIDTAVTLWQMAHGLQIQGPEALRLMVVQSGCRYHAETGFPDVIHAGLRLGHLGRTSFTTEVGLFANDDPTARAEGFFAQVHVAPDNRPSPIPQTLRDALGTIANAG